MKQEITYSKVIIEGFQSIEGQMIFPLNNVGLNLIKGHNGTGKSTTFNAILWAEYGINLKKSIATWEENQTENFKGTRVVVERTDGTHVYRIVRHLKYKGKTTGLSGGDKLMIFKRPIQQAKFTDADLVGDGLHKSDMQLIINEQLGMNAKTFLSSIFFGQRLESLVTTDNSTKRELFDELFDVDFVAQAKDKAKSEQDQLVQKVSNFTKAIEDAEDDLEKSEQRLEREQKILKEFTKNKKERVKNATEVLDAVLKKKYELSTSTDKIIKERDALKSGELDKLKQTRITQKEAVDTAQKSYDCAKKDVENCKLEIDKAEKNQKDFIDKVHKVDTICPSCEQPLDKSKVNKVIKNLQDSAKKEMSVVVELRKSSKSYDTLLEVAEKNLSTVQKSLKSTEDKISTFAEDVTKKATLTTTIDLNQKRLKELDEEISDAETSLTKTKGEKKPAVDTKVTEKLIQDYSGIIKDKDAECKIAESRLEKVKWWVSKGFGSSGLKSFVFNAMLSQLNSFTHAYASKLGFRVEFSIDMTKASKPFQTLIYKQDAVKYYEDLSGGQKQRVDICIAFAMHDLITINSNINILVMDESLSNLDQEGTEIVFELLREKAKDRSVYLITHIDIIDSLNTKTFNFSLDKNNNTVLV